MKSQSNEVPSLHKSLLKQKLQVSVRSFHLEKLSLLLNELSLLNSEFCFMLSADIRFVKTISIWLCSSKYAIDLTLQDHHEGSHLVRKAPGPPGMESWLQEEHKALSSGHVSASSARPPAMSQTKQNQLAAKKTQMAMAVAMKPG